MTKRPKILTIAALMTGLMIFPGSLRNVVASGPMYVATTGNDSNDCLSPASPCRTIQATINKANNGSTINVAPGVYSEAISIRQRENLTIQGDPTANIVPPAELQTGPLVVVAVSKEIHLRKLTITGDQNAVGGVQIGNSFNVFVDQCTVEDSGNGGIRAFDPSSVRISNSIIQRNRFHGIRVDTGANVELQGDPFSIGTSLVQQNPFAGVIVNGGNFGLLGSTIIQNNAVGILAEGGSVSTCCDAGERKILNNGTGIFMRGGHLEMRGPGLVMGNTVVGIEVVGGSASFGRFTTQRVIVKENGGTGILSIGSHLDLFFVDVIQNIGSGVILRDTSSARISNSVISNNGDIGVLVERLSTTELLNSVIMQNNRRFDFFCKLNSLGHGDRSGVRQMSCPGFN